MISRLLLTTFFMSSLYSQTSLATGVIDDANIDKRVLSLGNFNGFPTDVIKNEIFNSSDTLKTALGLNRGFYWLITGYRLEEVGLQHTQRSAIVPPIFWELKMFDDQDQTLNQVYTPENISPFLWFHLLRGTQNLSNAFLAVS